MSVVDTILGREPKEDDGLPSQAARGRTAERILHAEELAEFRRWAQSQTEAMERLTGRITNHVLEMGLFTIPAGPADALVTFNWHAAAGAIEVRNLAAANVMTVTSDAPATGGPPTSGHGVWRVPGASKDTIAVASHRVTVYGTAGDSFCMQAWTLGPAPAAT